MKIVIAGAGGFLGKEFTRQLSAKHEVLALSHNDLDISDRQAVDDVILSEQPALVVNCVVLGVDACELQPDVAWAVNVSGSEHLGQAAATIEAELLHISTNYVFDGMRERGSFYTLKDLAEPINIYGKTKLAGERAALTACARSFIFRTSWVFGHGKNNFLSSAHQLLAAGRPVRAIKDVWASPTCAIDFVKRVLEILPHRRYTTYHIANAGVCSYCDFAVEVARVSGISEPEISNLIEPVSALEIGQVARRPRYTPLRCLVSEELALPPMRDWREAAAQYVRDDLKSRGCKTE